MRNRLSTVPSSAEVPRDVAHPNDSADRFRRRLAAAPTSRGASRTGEEGARELRAEELEEGQRNFGQGNEEEDF